MIKVGVTGGIGSGKSIVCKIFEILGVPIYYADDKAKELMTSDKDLKANIIRQFGEQAYNENGQVNRSYLAGEVFHKPQQLEILNSFVHPAVKSDFDKWVASQKSRYIVKEAALLIEAGSYKELDYLILVTAPEKLRIERVMMRDDHRGMDQVREIIKNQLSEGEKKKYSNFLINNDESHPILSQVLEIHNLIAQKAPNFS